MKNRKDYTLLALFIPFAIAVLSCLPGCYGKDKDESSYLQDYQIRLHMDTVWVFDRERLVGEYINTKWDSQMDSIILKDNQ